MMNQATGAAQVGRTLNPQILQALFLTDGVRREWEGLLRQAFFGGGSVTVTDAQLRGWINTLQEAIRLLQQVPSILIFPPPPSTQFINAAIAQLQAAVQRLQAIPTTRSIPAQATLSLQTLLTLINEVRQAELFMIFALQSA